MPCALLFGLPLEESANRAEAAAQVNREPPPLPPPRAARDSARELPPRPRRGHLRLIAYFALLGTALCALGVALLRRTNDPQSREWILIGSVMVALSLAALGVVVQRLIVIRARWAETERFLAAIQAESAKYRALLEGAADMLVLLDGQSLLVLECNANARRGLDLEQASQEVDVLARFGRTDQERLRAALELARAAPGKPASVLDLSMRTAKGQSAWIDASIAGVDLKTSVVLLLALRDRSEQKNIERQLRIHERLSSLGLLTAGVAHEINNPLAGIGNYLSLLGRADLRPEQRQAYLEALQHGFERIRRIAHDLLRFARPRREESTADVAVVIEGALTLARFSEQLKHKSIQIEGSGAGLLALADPGHLEQVLLNLLINAGKACGPRGTVRIRVQGVDLGADQAQIEIAVLDDGPGIAPEHLEHLFDPFFSASGGTGLGLAVSYGLISAAGGALEASNLPQGGACFALRVPAKVAAPTPSSSPSPSPASPSA